MRLNTIAILAAVSVIPTGSALAQGPSPTGLGYVAPMPPRNAPAETWKDPAPHKALGFTTAPGVRIHVLDFGGGKGIPLVFLSGIGNNAHVFDDFAQRFTKDHRVIAISRRGFGESSHPETGYDQATLVEDSRIVLDSLGIRRAVLVGHSIGGYEITHFAATYPDRVAGVIYLDAGSDPVSADSIRRANASALAALEGLPQPPAAIQNPPSDADSASASAAWAYRVREGIDRQHRVGRSCCLLLRGIQSVPREQEPVPGKDADSDSSGWPHSRSIE